MTRLWKLSARSILALFMAIILVEQVAGQPQPNPKGIGPPMDASSDGPRSPSVSPPQTPVPPSGPAQAVPSIIRIEPVGALRLEPGAGPPWWSYLIPIVGPLVSGVLAFLGAWLGLRIAQRNTLRTVEVSQRTSESSIWQKANETELRDIQTKLDTFYFPFRQLLRTDHHFAQDLRNRQENPNYRLLVNLFDKKWLEGLSAGDRRLTAIICDYAQTLERFIADKAGMVDEQIVPYLARAGAHFRILDLAHKGELGTDPTRFSEYVYPSQLDAVLSLEIARLRRRIDQLRRNPGSQPESLEPLIIPERLKLTEWADPGGRISGAVANSA